MLPSAIPSKSFAKNVAIDFEGVDVQLSDNYFDLINDKPYKVVAKTSLSPDELMEKLTVLSVYHIAKWQVILRWNLPQVASEILLTQSEIRKRMKFCLRKVENYKYKQ